MSADAPAWSPDGRSIAFRGFFNNVWPGIYVMDADGSNVRWLTMQGDEDSDPVWSPDGRQIGFTILQDQTRIPYVVDVNTHDVQQVENQVIDDWGPIDSSQGRQIVVESGKIDIVDSAGAKLRRVVGVEDTSAETFRIDESVWSPFGNRVALVTSTGYTENVLVSRVSVIDTRSGRAEFSWAFSDFLQSTDFGYLGLSRGQAEALALMTLLFGPLLALPWSLARYRGGQKSIYVRAVGCYYIVLGVVALGWLLLVLMTYLD
jgi:dipeptidyl aminopeptidase/acylaminoacyl peptidase